MKQDQQRLIGFIIIGVIVYLAFHQSNITSDEIRFFLLLIPGIILHEIAHGAVANFFGDDTAKRAGRLTLNPLAHIDLFGTIILPALLVFSARPPLGYAKPVPVSLNKLRNPRFHGLLVGLAGPFTNLALAGVSLLLFSVLYKSNVSIGTLRLVNDFGLVNVFVAMFNLLPIPPLDGASLIEYLIPRSWAPGYYQLRRYSMYVFIILFLTGSSLFGRVLNDLDGPASRAYVHMRLCITSGCSALVGE